MIMFWVFVTLNTGWVHLVLHPVAMKGFGTELGNWCIFLGRVGVTPVALHCHLEFDADQQCLHDTTR
jgi:hypothetical protein